MAQPDKWSMEPKRVGVNHIAIAYPDREAWLKQLEHLKANDVEFIVRGNHGMTHSAYIADPDGYGIEVLYDLPEEVWSGDVDAALNYFEYLDPDDLDDRVDYQRFGAGRRRADAGARADRHSPDRHQLSASPAELLEVAVAAAPAGGAVLVDGLAGRSASTTRASGPRSSPRPTSPRRRRSSRSSPPMTHTTRSSARRAGQAPPRAATPGWSTRSTVRRTTPMAYRSACTSVAVNDAEGVAAAAIFEPFRGELFTAARGGGAWLGDDNGCGSRRRETLEQALVCTGVQSDDPRAIAEFGQRITELAGRCRGVRCIGSPALCLAYVAAGRIDAFVEADSTYAWDVGAGCPADHRSRWTDRGVRRRAAQPRSRDWPTCWRRTVACTRRWRLAARAHERGGQAQSS